MNKSKLEKYLSQVDLYLGHIPVFEKTDILNELKSTFFERLNNGQSEESITAELGTPKELAMSYMGDMIIEKQGFSFKRFMMIMWFYSIASMSWTVIIPILAVFSVTFFLSSVLSILSGIMGFLKGIFYISLIDNLKFMFFAYELKGISALAAGLIFAIIFFVLGYLFWKAVIHVIKYLKAQGWKLKK